MAKYTEFAAKIYDPVLKPFITPLRKRVVEIATELGAKKVLDLCCGTGNQLKFFKRAGFDDILGIDISKPMLAQAERGDLKVPCRFEDARETSFSDEEFDLVMVSFALHEMPLESAERVVKEGWRVLKRGKHFLTVDYCFDRRPGLLGRFLVHSVEKLAGKEHYRNFLNYKEKGGLHHFFPPEEKRPIIKEFFLLNTIAITVFEKNY